MKRLFVGACLAVQCVLVAGQDAATDRFQQFDKNGDGQLTREEFRAQKIFEAADANHDGMLTREEIATHFRPRRDNSPAASQPATTSAQSSAANVEIVKSLDVPYCSVRGADAKLLSLDIHAPPTAVKAPVIVYVHGGYWKAGDKSQTGSLPAFLCGRGFVFVSINYRLAPAVKHPVIVQDVARAVAWVHDHIAEHGGDPEQVFLTGHSAGAHLAALLGTDAKRLEEQGKPLSILRGVIPLDSAAMDVRNLAADDRRADSPYRAAFGDDPAAWSDASPLVHAQTAKTPPFQVIVAYGPAVEHKKAGVAEFATALRKNGTRVEIVDVSSFREHQSLMTQFGSSDDPVSLAVLEFIDSVRCEKADAGLGSERVLKLEGKAAAVAAEQLEAYRLRVMMMRFDQNKDGSITKDEMSANSFLFDRMDANKDGTVTAEELGDYEQQKSLPGNQPASSPM